MSQMLRMRTDLEIAPRAESGGGFSYVVKDTPTGEVFLLREEDYFICRSLDGTNSLAEIQRAFQRRFEMSLSAQHLDAFIRNLEDTGLLENTTVRAGSVNVQTTEPIVQWRLGDPDRLLRRIEMLCSWCFSRPAALFAMLIVAAACGISVRYGDDLLYEFMTVWDLGEYVFFVIPGVFCSGILAEVSKAVACKHYGGEIHGAGIGSVLKIFPRFYCDLSDVAWMPQKSVRLRIMAAGLIMQVLFLSVSVIMWEKGIPWTSESTFWLVVILIHLFALFFNANPLLNRDGYGLLTTWLNVSGLRERAFQVTKAWVRRKPLPEPLSTDEICGFRWYAVLSVVFSVGLVIAITFLLGYLLVTVLEGLGACIFLFLLYRIVRGLIVSRAKRRDTQFTARHA
ncbi:MAG TPA: hypothetical protein PKL48_00655 [Thermodesulfobacteriota bacterium]|nr:hypothetical protein [Deltaproteobacteria bacterium]HNU70205.1 hypothetical protein [Thermodesulfobacteriota bacterium]